MNLNRIEISNIKIELIGNKLWAKVYFDNGTEWVPALWEQGYIAYAVVKCEEKKYKNLRVKACVVYSYYNQDYIKELFNILDRDFKDLDRVVFSVVHGSVSNAEARQFNWDKYFEICDKIRRASTVRNIWDFHSLFTIALRIVKNDFLKDRLKYKDMYKSCGAGKKIIVINEIGEVFPCEPLWQIVGNLRENNYNLDKILNSDRVHKFQGKIRKEKCTCNWGIPMSIALLYGPRYYPEIGLEALKIISRKLRT